MNYESSEKAITSRVRVLTSSLRRKMYSTMKYGNNKQKNCQVNLKKADCSANFKCK